jgi:hypothetical protein
MSVNALWRVGQASTPAAGLQTRSRFMFAACRYVGQTSRSGCPLGRVLQDPLFARHSSRYPAVALGYR